MTNSMLNADNAYMARDKFKKAKKRFPPNIEFLKHGLLRLSEIIYRIGLFSLFWTVVGGFSFCFLIAFECLLVVVWIALQKKFDTKMDDLHQWFLILNQVTSS